MNRKLVAFLAAVALALSAAAVAIPSDAAEEEREFKVNLRGSEEVPPVATAASGFAEVELKDESLEFEVEVCNVVGVTQAHIHVGPIGVNGPVVLFLYGNDPTGAFSAEDCRRLSSGVLTPANLIPRPAIGINDWDDFVAAFMAGNTYANVHTLEHPGGEIRGQLD